MKKFLAFVFSLLLPVAAGAQTYPSSTFNNLTAKGAVFTGQVLGIDATTGNNNGQSVGIISGDGIGSGGGGVTSIDGGNGGQIGGTGPGGNVFVGGGGGGSASGNAGGITLQGGTASVGTGGNIQILAGPTVSGKGGNITIGLGGGTTGNGNLLMTSIPTTDPGVNNSLWSNNGALTFSGQTGPSAPGPAINAQTGQTYTVQASDAGKVVTFSNATIVNVALPQATGSFGAKWQTTFINLNGGFLTITPNISTINGRTRFFLSYGQSITLTSDGTNYVAGAGSTLFSGTSGSLSNTIADNTVVGGDLIGNNSINISTDRISATQVATGNQSVDIGQFSTASGTSTVAIGNNAQATANETVAVGPGTAASVTGGIAIGENVQAGTLGTNPIAIGQSTIACTTNTIAIGSSVDTSCTATNGEGIGSNILINGANSGAFGTGITINGADSFVFGVNGTNRSNVGAIIHSPTSLLGSSSLPGRSQHEEYLFLGTTNTAVAKRMTTDNATANTLNVAAVGTSAVQIFTCRITIVDTVTGEYVSYYLPSPGTISVGAMASAAVMGTGNPAFVAGPTSAVALVLGAAPTITADTGAGGYNISYTPPVGNVDLLYAIADLEITNLRFN